MILRRAPTGTYGGMRISFRVLSYRGEGTAGAKLVSCGGHLDVGVAEKFLDVFRMSLLT